MPRSRSMSLLSITRSATFSLSRKVPLWRSSWSTRVVLPWSTWAMMAMLRICLVMVSVRPGERLHLERAQKAVGDQFAGGDVGAAEKGARRCGRRRRARAGASASAHAAAQAGEEAAGLVVGQAHGGPVGQQRVGRQQPRLAVGLVEGLQRVERDGVVDVERAAAGAAQRGQVGAAAQRLADVLGQRADVGALAAAHVDHQLLGLPRRRCRWR